MANTFRFYSISVVFETRSMLYGDPEATDGTDADTSGAIADSIPVTNSMDITNTTAFTIFE